MSDPGSRIATLIDASGPGHVWVPAEFAHLASRDVTEKTLQRMILKGDLRRKNANILRDPKHGNAISDVVTVKPERTVLLALACTLSNPLAAISASLSKSTAGTVRSSIREHANIGYADSFFPAFFLRL